MEKRWLDEEGNMDREGMLEELIDLMEDKQKALLNLQTVETDDAFTGMTYNIEKTKILDSLHTINHQIKIIETYLDLDV